MNWLAYFIVNLGKSSVLSPLLAEIIQGKDTQVVTHPQLKSERDGVYMLAMALSRRIMLSYVGFVSCARACASARCMLPSLPWGCLLNLNLNRVVFFFVFFSNYHRNVLFSLSPVDSP